MPYARRARRPAARRPRRYPMRKRVAKSTRLYKSTTAKSNFKSIGLPKELTVKHPYYSEVSPSASTYRFIILGNSLDPVPINLANVGSAPTSYLVNANDRLVPGLEEYSGLYSTAQTMASSWNLQFVNNYTPDVDTQLTSARVVMCVIPYYSVTGAPLPITLETRIAELDAMQFDDVCLQPYAKTVQVPYANGMNSKFLKVKRSTKTMLRVTNLRDSPEATSQTVPLTDADIAPATTGWAVYVRMIAAAETAAAPTVTVKGTLITRYTNRRPLMSSAPVLNP